MVKATTILLLLHLNVFAQHQERTVFVYNATFGGITSGVGAIINRPKAISWKKAFFKGFWQGSIGGLLNYSGKKTLYLVNEKGNDIYSWPAKILHASGTSIMENAALCQPFLQNWHIDYGLVRFDFSLGVNHKFKVRILPEAVVATILADIYGKFDLSSSLRTGEIIFKANKILHLPNSTLANGVTFGRTIVYVDTTYSHYTKYRILSHELVHRYQYDEYQIFNSWIKPSPKKIESKPSQNIFSNYIYPDFPYFILPYYLNGLPTSFHPFRNFYEFEAERFSTNAHVVR